MTLSEFQSVFFSRPNIESPPTLYIFADEDSAVNWIDDKYFGSNNRNYELIMAFQSDMVMKYTVKEKWVKAEVQHFYAVEPDVIVVVVSIFETSNAVEYEE